jgi:hypothetical protein
MSQPLFFLTKRIIFLKYFLFCFFVSSYECYGLTFSETLDHVSVGTVKFDSLDRQSFRVGPIQSFGGVVDGQSGRIQNGRTNQNLPLVAVHVCRFDSWHGPPVGPEEDALSRRNHDVSGLLHVAPQQGVNVLSVDRRGQYPDAVRDVQPLRHPVHADPPRLVQPAEDGLDRLGISARPAVVQVQNDALYALVLVVGPERHRLSLAVQDVDGVDFVPGGRRQRLAPQLVAVSGLVRRHQPQLRLRD